MCFCNYTPLPFMNPMPYFGINPMFNYGYMPSCFAMPSPATSLGVCAGSLLTLSLFAIGKGIINNRMAKHSA